MKCTTPASARVGFVTVLSGDLVAPSPLRFPSTVRRWRLGAGAWCEP